MIFIKSPNGEIRRRLPFYLAMEEWAAKHLPQAEYFFTWKVAPTVIFGRNQCAHLEVNLDFCREKHIEVYRRKSGGGCVYADLNNLMLSYIAPGGDVQRTFASFSRRTAQALLSLGVPATVTGRNDIEVDGHKVAGAAFYRLANRSIVHSTLLWMPDFATMSRAITPSKSKLESKQIKSVDSRVTGLSNHLPSMSIDTLNQYLIDQLCDSSYTLTDDDMAQMQLYETRYYQPDWTYGRHDKPDSHSKRVRRHGRIPGVGEMDVMLTLRHGAIDDMEITGDYFLTGDLRSMVTDKIRNCPMDKSILLRALEASDVSDTIAGLSNDAFVDLLTFNAT